MQILRHKAKPSKKLFIFIGLLATFLSACKPIPGITSQESEHTLEMSTQTATPESFTLPAPLFFLQNGQIWRMDTDANSTHQITHENNPIDSFDISINGEFVYTSNNHLLTCNMDGSNQQVLRAGPKLPLMTDKLESLNNIEYITSAIHSPLWSPDGKRIAFIENGLQIMNLETGQSNMVWEHLLTSSAPILFESILSWSPEGKHLLVSEYTYPIEKEYDRAISLLQLGGSMSRNISSIFGGTFAWNPVESELFLANSKFGTEHSLMRCTIETVSCQLIAEFVPARWYFFYAHPFFRTDDERLLVFMGSANDPINPPEKFNLISLQPNGYGRNELRNDRYPIETTLWAPDGQGVLVHLSQDINEAKAGSIIWLSTNESPVVVLPLKEFSNLRWGVE